MDDSIGGHIVQVNNLELILWSFGPILLNRTMNNK